MESAAAMRAGIIKRPIFVPISRVFSCVGFESNWLIFTDPSSVQIQHAILRKIREAIAKVVAMTEVERGI